MKKSMAVILVVGFSLFLLTSCAGMSEFQKGFSNAPEWVSNPAIEGGIAAIGIGEKSQSAHKARTLAEHRGRVGLARIIETDIKALLEDFTEAAGIGSGEAMGTTFLDVSKSTTSAVLKGSRQIRMWPAPNGDTYVLMAIDPGQLKNIVKDSVEASFKKDDILWQQFRSKKAHEKLEQEIEKSFKKYKAIEE